MNWKKIGLIFTPISNLKWMKTHCQQPVPLLLKDNIYRIYFASRNEKQYSQVGFFDFNIENLKVLNYSTKPIITTGGLGTFDEHGVYPSSLIKRNGKLYMYYIGWNKAHEADLFYTAIGLAISDDNGLTFKKYSHGPILDRGIHDPCFVSGPQVFKNQESEKLTMFYISCFKWRREISGKLRSFYHLKSCESVDGLNWDRKGKVILDLKNKNERDISRCSVIFEKGEYHMWYSYNSLDNPYKIGYANSKDFLNWKRIDHLNGIKKSSDWFDDKMNCYPFVFKHNDSIYMLYNGNNYGKDGIILSKVNKDD